ncbi:hypothetical protein IBX65_07780 [Candidatus Aerophobetes bacterium]|nr:hypothetical protein [Candidatus Aerophobetes bacterium]
MLNKKGLTLVELLIGCGIALVILMAVGFVYVSSDRSLRFGREVIRSEADLRLAMDWLVRDIREAEQLEGTGEVVDGHNAILLNSLGAWMEIRGPTVSSDYEIKQESGTSTLELKCTDISRGINDKFIVNIFTPSSAKMQTSIAIFPGTASGSTVLIASPAVQIALSSSVQTSSGREYKRTLTSKVTMRNAK